jgi:DNA processing protein
MNGDAPRRLSSAERLDWLRLIRSENIGPRTFWALIEHYGSAARALAVLPELARRGGAMRSIKVASKAEAKREMDELAKLGGAFLAHGEADYPSLLAAVDTAPPLIAVRGELAVLQRPMVAIVGSRNASAAGLALTERLARGLAEAGLVVVSGLARGIDSRAHQATLESGTVAVLPGGQDRVYPSENAALLERICDKGAALSEMPLGWEPRGRDFPRRNRIVAGLAHGTLVVEAARRSGSLITARLANEQGREVFAVPGSPLDPRAEGTNDLLKQGATLCTEAKDVIDAIAPLLEKAAGEKPPSGLRAPKADDQFAWDHEYLFGDGIERDPLSAAMARDAAERDEAARQARNARELAEAPSTADIGGRVAHFLGPSPVGIDDIVRAIGAPARDVQQAVLELELAGRLVRHGGNLVSLLARAD